MPIKFLNNVSVDQDVLYVDGINNRVGIGTTSPGAKLEVTASGEMLRLNDTNSAGNPYMSFYQNGTRRSFIQHADTGDFLKLASEYGGISFFTGTGGSETQKMAILSGGNVGIGNTSPSYLLDVNEDDNVVAFRVTGGGGGAAMASFVRDVGSTGASVNINAQSNFPQIQLVSTGNTFSIGGDTSGNFKISDANAIGTNDRITIDNTGNVGIGTTSPARRLHVSSSDQSTARIRLSNTNTGSGGDNIDLVAGVNNVTQDGFSIYNATSNQTQLVIQGSGNVGINTTLPKAKLDVNGNFRINTYPLELSNTPAWGVPTQNIIGADDNTNGATLTLMNTNSAIPAGGASGTIQFVALDDGRNSGGSGYASASISVVSSLAPGTGTSGGGNILFKTQTFYSPLAERMRINSTGNVGIGVTSPSSKLHVSGGIQLAHDNVAPSASKVGTLRYYTSGNNSYLDMCMQTGTSTYVWVNIVQNSW